MRAHVLQHVSFEGLGSIAAWLSQRGAGTSSTRFFESDPLPALDDVDLLIILGGPMSVNDEEQLPWLREEKAFIARAVASGKAVLGICLGAQLIASALGSRVYPGSEKEIGWWRIAGESAPPRRLCLPGDGYGIPLARRDLRFAGGGASSGQQRGLQEPGIPDRRTDHRPAVSP